MRAYGAASISDPSPAVTPTRAISADSFDWASTICSFQRVVAPLEATV
nr:hypothetical protein [Alistipes sp. D31t1_170403_E11]